MYIRIHVIVRIEEGTKQVMMSFVCMGANLFFYCHCCFLTILSVSLVFLPQVLRIVLNLKVTMYIVMSQEVIALRNDVERLEQEKRYIICPESVNVTPDKS